MRTEYRVNDMTIHRIVEQEQGFTPMLEFLPNLSKATLEENLSWLAPGGYNRDTGNVVLCYQSYVVKTPHHNILVDACIGNDKNFPLRPTWNKKNDPQWMNALAAAGLGVEDIDFVMCSHLHGDHVGWNTRLENGRWVPTFPQATYIMSEREFLHWQDRYQQEPDTYPWIGDSVLPVVDAGRTKLVTSAYALSDLVQLIPTPGHTIDHFSVKVGQSGAIAILTGDMIHSPLQALYPELGMFVDFDSRQAGETRQQMFERYCDTETLFCTAHFPVQSIGHIRRSGETFRFVAI